MIFSNMTYNRPDVKKIEQQFKQLLKSFKESGSFEEQDESLAAINKLRSEVDTHCSLVHIRHSIDTNDSFYKKEQDYIDEITPILQGYESDVYKELVQATYRSDLEEKWGKQLFMLAELSLKTFDEAVIEDLQKENKLITEYNQIIASAKIEFDGEERTLSELTPFELDKDRNVRKEAANARYAFMSAREDDFDRIYDELVDVRTTIAHKLGFENFVELGYARMSRTDYDQEMVANFRKQVVDYIVPVATRLRKRQEERIGVESLHYYDEPFSFRTGNAKPKGDAEWIIANGENMYSELSPETKEFYHFMQENELMDLLSKKGKQGGGYCAYLSEYKAPFIFANFNGTSGDIDVLTHEAGHAFQGYESRHFTVPEYNFPTMEAAEIHSMSMEFFTWPWMESFFKEDVEKYKFDHLSSGLLFIPYGVAVDEFQHFVYENPKATPEDRKQAWRSIEKKYLPHRNYENHSYLENGGFWQRQSHIFQVPFYYIDYTLAQICAFQYWRVMNEDWDGAWESYLTLCKAGGSQSFTSLVKEADLRSPFSDGTVKVVIDDIEAYLNSVDDKKL
ncbi:M3 family oligoendopeptidase [Alteribacter aurantiacus]|uniref:M3 family oligoendopeptidase n=1 Tax=Alteribacter aurantiacus TaxID=254410 RepID=UPI000404FE5B|nr:M3 family oligoendopeptidase [Alteribacter aurantiacus]